MGKLNQLMVIIEEVAVDEVCNMDDAIESLKDTAKDEAFYQFEAMVEDMLDQRGLDLEDLETLGMNLDKVWEDAVANNSENF